MFMAESSGRSKHEKVVGKKTYDQMVNYYVGSRNIAIALKQMQRRENQSDSVAQETRPIHAE
jgi:hypothetical protein